MTEDIRTILIKFADRIHNLKTLHAHKDPEKIQRIALESLTIYAPIADRLGIYEFKNTIETLCFKHLHPEAYAQIEREFSSMKKEKSIFERCAKRTIAEALSINFPIRIETRIKSAYSIYKKMKKKGYSHIYELHDIFAIRIITQTEEQCYIILGQIHNAWHPIPGRFKDFIANPKQNKYQSLHTTVIGLFPEFQNKRIEIQIRTQDMHQASELGIAAHFEYKERGKSRPVSVERWIQELREAINNTEDGELITQVGQNFF